MMRLSGSKIKANALINHLAAGFAPGIAPGLAHVI